MQAVISRIFIFKNIRWMLIAYDTIMYVMVIAFIVSIYGRQNATLQESFIACSVALLCLIFFRWLGHCYHMILRYGGVHVYLRLFATDFLALLAYFPVKALLPLPHISSIRWLMIIMLNLLGALAMRLIYRYCFRYGVRRNNMGSVLRFVLRIFAGASVVKERKDIDKRIKIAIIGAGRLGAVLADELLSNDSAAYVPVCFIDEDSKKSGRDIMNLPVLAVNDEGLDELNVLGVQEIVFAIMDITDENRKRILSFYRDAGYKLKVYDFPVADVAKKGKRSLRDFDIEELLFRKPIMADTAVLYGYFSGKSVLVTGGGGSIGSELCRQLAKLKPKVIVALDIAENGVYDLQQELRLMYGADLKFFPEICSVCDTAAVTRVMEEYHPDIVVHAAAHKHVPLMEKNCIEAVVNNVFGTLNVIELCEKYGVGRFMMVSTDKAVNPTNIMGATKRMCEIIARAHSASGVSTVFSDTRFGNVLGSAGSVIPLFKRQIANGGPITLTDKRIIRYFMTIPEASQLVL